MSEVPALLDRRAVETVYGLRRVDIDRAFRLLPVLRLPGSRKCYIRREALDALIEEWTRKNDQVWAAR